MDPPPNRSREQLKAALRAKRASARNAPATARKARPSLTDELLRRGIDDPLLLSASKDPGKLLSELERFIRPDVLAKGSDESDDEALPPLT